MNRKITYKNEPKDGLELPPSGFEVIPRARQRTAGLPPPDPPGTDYDVSATGDHVILTPQRGGRRKGAGRKSSGHVRMQLLVSPITRKKIEALAKRHKVTLSAAVEHMAAQA